MEVPPVYPAPPPRNRVSVAAILVVIAALAFTCLAGIGLVGWLALRRFRAAVPAHAGFGSHRQERLSAGWWKTSFPELRLRMDTPCTLSPNFRSIRASWVQSYVSYHGKSPVASFAIGALWMDPRDPHLRPERQAEDTIALLRANPAYSEVRSETKWQVVDGSQAVVVNFQFRRPSEVLQRGAYLGNGGRALYILETYTPGNRAQAERDWDRMIASIRLGP